MVRRMLVSCCVLLLVVGCGPRVEVAKDKILAQIDSLLGEIDVKRKAAETAVEDMESGIDQLKKSRIEAKVKLKQFADSQADLETKLADTDKALERLRDYLKENKEVEISGKKFTVAQLKEMADKAISARKNLASQSETLKSSMDRLEKVASSLEQREQDAQTRIANLKQSLTEIDTRSVALNSIKDAAAISGGGETLDFESVEKQVQELSTKIDVELAFQDEKWKESEKDDTQTLDAIIRDTKPATDTVAEIEKILSGNAPEAAK